MAKNFKNLNYLIHYEERQAEEYKKAEEAAASYAGTIRPVQEETKKMADSANDIAEKYAKLAQGVNVFTNANFKLTNDEYVEFIRVKLLPKEAMALLRELSIAAPAFMRPTTPQFEQTLSQGGQNVTVSEGAFHFDMPNVVDAQGMVRELQNDRRLQKAVKQVVFGEGLGDGRLGINRI